MLEDLFCPECKRLKKRCICKGVIEKNLKLLMENYKEFLKPIFEIRDEIVYYRVFEPFNEVPTESLNFLPKRLSEVLRNRGIEKLYPFQKRAMELLIDGKNVVITAPTGFGKTEAFMIPAFYKTSKGKVIVFYPTKALAKDQELKIKDYSEALGIKVVRFDGDSSLNERRAVFSGEADFLLTNPDMVDYHLRNTPSFRKFVNEVIFVAVDELHAYTGFFGSNMHYLVKRLEKFSDFQIACTSATLANAKEFAEELFEREFVHVHGDHRKTILDFIMVDCSNVYSTVKEIVQKFPKKKILVFGNSYKVVETINWVLRKSKVNSAVHKGGLTRDLRDEVERNFRCGKIRVVVATPTLELGIDIGDVDVVISELVPYSQFLQRIGRAGRKGQESIGVLLLRSDDPISAYYKRNPDEYFLNQANGYVEKDNEEVMKFQYLSMIAERKTRAEELKPEILKLLISEELVKDGKFLSLTDKGYLFLERFSMRGIGDRIRILYKGKEIGERVLPIAVKELFPGAILIHNGQRYRCKEINLQELRAEVEMVENGEEVTDPLYTSIPKVFEIESSIQEPVEAYYATFQVSISVYGYLRRNVFREEKDVFLLSKPVEFSFRTKGFLFSCPFPSGEDLEDFYSGSFHAVEHVLIESSNVLTGGGSREIGGISTPEGDLFVYDSAIGGSGLSKLLFKRIKKAFEISYEVLTQCDCKRSDGCPRCTYSYQCGNNNRPLNKKGAIEVIEKIKSGEKRETNWKKYRETTKFKYFP
ncbi:MAG: DEAD/DEAH box helicase [Archaeoglobaceae archaeon]|nr:DEAD/DEAH box helicase [Archaeoglobaceae archaeon]MDW7989948.1 DEAD/DEAH box helicase [Archaeoglobaceae archaeon]